MPRLEPPRPMWSANAPPDAPPSASGSRVAAALSVAPPILIGVLGVVQAVRLPLWRDELATVMFASVPLATLDDAVSRVDAVLAPYYALAHVVQSLSGTPVALRIVSVIAAVAATMLVMRLAQRWWGAWAGIATGFALVANPLFVQMASTARPYALVVACAAGAIVALDRALSEERLRWWPVFAAATAVAGWLHLFGLLSMLATVVLLVGRPGAQWRRYCISAGAAVVAVVPLAMVAAGQSGQVSWIPVPDARRAVGTLFNVVAYQVDETIGPIDLAVAVPALVLGVIGALLAFARTPDQTARGTRFVFAVAFATVPWGVLLAVSLLVSPFLRTAYLTPSTLGIALLVGAALAFGASPPARSVRVMAAVAASAFIAATAWVTIAAEARAWRQDDFPGIAATLSERLQPGDVLLVIQREGETGYAAGVARYTEDRPFTRSLVDEMGDGDWPGVFARVVRSTAPLSTEPFTSASSREGAVWTVALESSRSDAERAALGRLGLACATGPQAERIEVGPSDVVLTGCGEEGP